MRCGRKLPGRSAIIAQMPLNPHQSVDHYEIIALIGSGGMGEVYRERDTRVKREGEIKTLHCRFGPVAEV